MPAVRFIGYLPPARDQRGDDLQVEGISKAGQIGRLQLARRLDQCASGLVANCHVIETLCDASLSHGPLA